MVVIRDGILSFISEGTFDYFLGYIWQIWKVGGVATAFDNQFVSELQRLPISANNF